MRPRRQERAGFLEMWVVGVLPEEREERGDEG